MNGKDISIIRMHNQRLATSSCAGAQELAGHMGALQAQSYRMVKWALGLRLGGTTKEDIEQAIADGKIIRTHLLRPTWHFVAAKDLRWMLKLTAPRIKVAARSRQKQLGLSEELISRSKVVVGDALAKEKYLSRKELVVKLEEAGFENKDNLASHLLLHAELDGIICNGPSKNNNYTYALLDERIPGFEKFTKDEALAELVRRYFQSHGPATLEDFTWWSGLTKTSARKALEMIGPDFTSAEIGSQEYWFDEKQSLGNDSEQAYLLPAYDEFIISYRNRDMIIPEGENRKKAISNNGIFRPVILHNGQVIGLWKRSVKKEAVYVELDFFERPSKKIRSRVETAAEKFAFFLGKKLNLIQ